MRITVLLFVSSHLGIQLVQTASGGDESEERWRGVERSSAELGVSLETDKVWVV